jgi:hypothetical protein
MDICVTITGNQVNGGLFKGIHVPNVHQISRQVAKIRNPNTNTQINEFDNVEAKLNSLQFELNKFYDPNEAFCNGVKLGEGSDADHFIVNFTSLKLLQTISQSNTSVTLKSIYHLDGTYKITKNRFPVIVIGRSDHNGTFFPISVSLVSHEPAVDF